MRTADEKRERSPKASNLFKITFQKIGRSQGKAEGSLLRIERTRSAEKKRQDVRLVETTKFTKRNKSTDKNGPLLPII